jgi:hypothetical protein
MFWIPALEAIVRHSLKRLAAVQEHVHEPEMPVLSSEFTGLRATFQSNITNIRHLIKYDF